MYNSIFICSIVSLILVFPSCQSTNSNREILMHQLEIELANGTSFMEREINEKYHELENKLQDPQTVDRATRWYPKAKFLKAQTKTLITQLESSKLDLSNPDVRKKCLNVLDQYKNKIIQLDDETSKVFGGLINNVNSALDSISINGELRMLDLSSMSELESKTLLAKIIHQVKTIEFVIVEYCNQSSEAIICGYHRFSALIGQNTTHLKNGETLEISAGIGAFSTNVKPLVKIDNVIQVCDPSTGIMQRTFKVNEKTGKHFKLVHIEFSNPEGKKETLEKKIEYTIDD